MLNFKSMLIFGVKVELDMNFEYDILLPERMVRRMQKELTDLKCPQEDEYLVKIPLTKPLDIYYVCQEPRQHIHEADSPLLKNADNHWFISYNSPLIAAN